jgi:hypothetical protein
LKVSRVVARLAALLKATLNSLLAFAGSTGFPITDVNNRLRA